LIQLDDDNIFDQRMQAHLSELLDDYNNDNNNNNDDNNTIDVEEHVSKRARTTPSTPSRATGKSIERMVCDWSGDGLLAFVSAHESRRIYGDRRRIFIAHVNAPEHVGVIETIHEAPIAVLQFAPLSTGRYLLSIDCVSQVGIWVCEGAANRWVLVPSLNMRLIEFSYTAIWVRWNAMRTPFAPQCRTARPGAAPQTTTVAQPRETPLEQKFLNGLRKPDSTLSYWIGMPCLLGVSRGRLLALYERSEDQRWGYVADHSSLPPDAVIGDVAQHADGTIRVVVVAHGNSAALVYLVDLTVRDTAQLSTRLEASIDISYGRWIEHVRFNKLPLVSASIVLVTSSDPIADGAADADDVEGSHRWRIERWQVRQRSQSLVVSHVDAAGASTQRDVTTVSSEWYVAAGCLLELGETVTDVLPSSSGLLALAMGHADEVQLRSADTLERLAASVAVGGGVADYAGEPVSVIATRTVANFCMAFSPCGTCLVYSTPLGAAVDCLPLYGLRIARLTPTIIGGMSTREQLARYLADCYEYAIVMGHSSWDVDAIVASVAPTADDTVPVHELVAHHVLAECSNNTNYASQMRGVLANLSRLHGRGSIECIDWQALLYLKNVIGVVAVVVDNADVQRYHEAYVAQGGTSFTTTPVELAKPNSLITIAPQLNWIMDFVALVLAQAIEFGEQQRRLNTGAGAEPLSRVPQHMAASDAATVASLLVQRAGRKLPLLRIVFDAHLLRALVKMTFVCGMLGEQWNALVAVQRGAPIASQLALFANLTDVKALLSLLTTLTAVVDSAYKQLPKPDLSQDMVRGVHGSMLANSVGARIDSMLVNEQARDANLLSKHSALRAYIARRAQMIAQSIGYVMGDSGGVTLASPAAMGLLLCVSDLVPRNVGVLENDVYGLTEMSESMQSLLRVDCLTRQPLRQRAWNVCVQCGRFLFSGVLHDLHAAWSNCCPVCFSRFVEGSSSSSSSSSSSGQASVADNKSDK
jgi:predicted regulator of Ras-like GTPase activity (Roadblock/LC7/MglB family)